MTVEQTLGAVFGVLLYSGISYFMYRRYSGEEVGTVSEFGKAAGYFSVFATVLYGISVYFYRNILLMLLIAFCFPPMAGKTLNKKEEVEWWEWLLFAVVALPFIIINGLGIFGILITVASII